MKQPNSPNPYDQAAAQQGAELGASQSSSIINNPNVYTPWGNQTYDIAGYETIYDAKGNAQYVPRYTQTQTLSPDQMKLYGLQTQMGWNLGQTGVEQSAKLRDLLGQGVDTSSLSAWQQGPKAGTLATTFGGQGDIRQDQGPTDRAAVQNAMMQLYNRQSAGKNAAEQAQLTARGAGAGTPIYNTAAQRQGEEFTDASLKAYLGSGEEARAAQAAYNQAQQQRYQEAAGRGEFYNSALLNQFNMGGSEADRANALRQAQLQEVLGLRNQPLNEIIALMGGSGITTPQFNPYSSQGVGAAPVGSYIGQNYANSANATNQFNSGLFNLAGNIAGGMFGTGGMFGA